MKIKTYLNSIVVCAAILLLGSGYAVAGTWTTLDAPGAYQTSVSGISGNNVVGYYSDNNKGYGFLYNGGSWTELPLTNITCIDGSTVVSGGGHTYNLTTGSLGEIFISSSASIHGISGNNVVGEASWGGAELSGLFSGIRQRKSTLYLTILGQG